MGAESVASTASLMARARLLGIIRLGDTELVIAAASAAIEAGLQVVEVPFTVKGAVAAITALRSRFPGALVGAGTIRTEVDLRRAIDAGAQFLVSPGINAALYAQAERLGRLFIPGAYTATEVDLALSLGASLIKIFPVEPGGVAYLKALLQPFPELQAVATGGISTSMVGDYLEAGAAVVALGGSLFPSIEIERRGPGIVTSHVVQALERLKNAT